MSDDLQYQKDQHEISKKNLEYERELAEVKAKHCQKILEIQIQNLQEKHQNEKQFLEKLHHKKEGKQKKVEKELLFSFTILLIISKKALCLTDSLSKEVCI